MSKDKILVKLKPQYGKRLAIATPSTSIVLKDEATEVDMDTYERRLKKYVDVVTKEKKREKKTEDLFFKDEEK